MGKQRQEDTAGNRFDARRFLAEDHKGVRVSAQGLLGRFRDGDEEDGHRELCGQMITHLEELATRFYAGDVAVVDEFLQLYGLDEKRPEIRGER